MRPIAARNATAVAKKGHKHRSMNIPKTDREATKGIANKGPSIKLATAISIPADKMMLITA
jgi:phage tail protein X